MSTIVVTTDLSDAARRALPTAKRLADAFDLPLVLLHVVHAPALAPAFTGSVSLDVRDAEQELERLAQGLGDRVQTRVAEAEEVAAGIANEADAVGAELLVVASHGRSGLQRLRLGSVAEKLIETARIPVVGVPAHDEDDAGAGPLLVASDLTETATHAFPIANRLARALSRPMTLLVIGDPSEDDSKRLEEQAAQLRGDGPADVATCVVSASDPAEGILDQARSANAAFVCAAASPKSALRRFLLGSVSREVLRNGSVPVVVVPAKSE